VTTFAFGVCPRSPQWVVSSWPDFAMGGVMTCVADGVVTCVSAGWDDGRTMAQPTKTSTRRQPQPAPPLRRGGPLQCARTHGIAFQDITRAVCAATVENLLQQARRAPDQVGVALAVHRAVDPGVDYPLRGWHCRTCGHAAWGVTPYETTVR